MNRSQEYIRTIIEEGSFSKAAERLFISQPALSIIVKKTEEELGLPLFNRTSKPITLTPAGELYLNYIKKIQVLDKEFQRELNTLREHAKGTLNIGTTNYFSSFALPELTIKFKKLYPQYTVSISEGNNSYLSQLLQSSEIDLAICLGPLDNKLFDSQDWKDEQLILAVPASWAINEELKEYRMTFNDIKDRHHIKPEQPAVNLAKFADCDFIIMKRGNDGYARELSLCQNAGFKPKVALYIEQMTTNYSAASRGLGCTFVRTDIVNNISTTNKLCFYKIDDPLTIRTIHIYSKKTGDISQAAKTFIDFLKQS